MHRRLCCDRPMSNVPQNGDRALVRRVEVRPVEASEVGEWTQKMTKHHYLQSAALVGNALRYVATVDERWVALLGWSTPALKCKSRDEWIGWSPAQQWKRLKLVVNNARFLVLPGVRVPNLASRVLALSCRRLSLDWQAAFGNPALVAETFVDPQRYRGTCYLAAGWQAVGTTKGSGRRAGRYYEHGREKLVFVKELSSGGCELLADPRPHPELLEGDRSMDVSRLPLCGPGSLHEALSHISDYRCARGRRYRKIHGLLTLASAAVLAGNRSYAAIAQWAKSQPDSTLRAMGCTYCVQTGGFRAPSEDTIRRAISNIDAHEVDRATSAWLIKLGVDIPGNAIAIDGKALRGSYGNDGKQVHLLAALTHREGAVIAQQRVDDKSNEIPGAKKMIREMDIRGSMITVDAMHTQVETAELIKKRARTT